MKARKVMKRVESKDDIYELSRRLQIYFDETDTIKHDADEEKYCCLTANGDL